MKSHSKRILSLVFALLMLFQQVLFAAQTVDLFNPELGAKTVDLIPGEDDTNTVDLLTPSDEDSTKTVDLLNPEQPSATIEQQKPIIEKNENKTVDTITPRGDDIVPAEGKKSTTTIVVGGDEVEEGETNENSEISPEEIILPEENEKEEKKDASFEDEEHHENAGVLPWSTDLVKPWSIYRAPKTVYRPGEDLDLTELLVEIKTGRSGSLYNIEDLINDDFTTITRTRKSDGQKVRLDDKIYEDETMTIHMDGCQDLTIDFTVDENLKDEAKAFEAFQQNLIREEFRNGLDFSLYLIKKGEKENPVVAYSLDPHKLTPIGNGVDKKLKDGPLFDLKDINTWDRYDIETIGKVKAILERSAEIKDTENIRKKLITQLAIWNVTSNIIPKEIDATVSEPTEIAPELKPEDETKENPEEDKKDEPIEITEPTTPEEETENIEKENEKVEDTKDETVEIKTEEKVEEKIEAEESEKIEEKAPVQSTVHKIVFNAKEIDVPYDDIELSDEEYELYKELTSLEAVELKNEDEDLKIYEPIIIEETENQYADLVTIGESDIDSIERVATEVTFDAVEYSFQNLYHTLETSSMLGFGQPRDFNVLLKATMKASRKIVEGDKFEVEILSKTLPILNGEEGRANDIQIDGKVVATAEYIAEEHKIVYTFVEDLDTDKVEIEQEFKQVKEEKATLLNMLEVSENLVLDAVRGAEGDENSEENPEELEISPEDENATIKLVLGNTPVQYSRYSFETKKFRLKTTMTAKAAPVWQIPVDWTFDVNIGPYLKPDPKNPLKSLYDPNNPSVEVARPKYDPDKHVITYTFIEPLNNTKTFNIDQLLAFDTDKIANREEIEINIVIAPKNYKVQKMPTIKVRKDDPRSEIISQFVVENKQDLYKVVYPYMVSYVSRQSVNNRIVTWDIDVDTSTLKREGLDYNNIALSLYIPNKQGLSDYRVSVDGTEGAFDTSGDLVLFNKTIAKDSIPDNLKIKVQAKTSVERDAYSLGIRITPDKGYIKELRKELETKKESLNAVFGPLFTVISYLKDLNYSTQFDDGFNLLDTRITAIAPPENGSERAVGYNDSLRSFYLNKTNNGKVDIKISETIDLKNINSVIGSEIYTNKIPTNNIGISTQNLSIIARGTPVVKIYIPKIDGSYELVSTLNNGKPTETQFNKTISDLRAAKRLLPGTIIEYDYSATYGTGNEFISMGIDLNKREVYNEQLLKYTEANKFAEAKLINIGNKQNTYRVGKYVFKKKDEKYNKYVLFKIIETGENGYCVNPGIENPTGNTHFHKKVVVEPGVGLNALENAINKYDKQPRNYTGVALLNRLKKIFFYYDKYEREHNLDVINDEDTKYQIRNARQAAIFDAVCNKGKDFLDQGFNNGGAFADSETRRYYNELNNIIDNEPDLTEEQLNSVTITLYPVADNKRIQNIITGEVENPIYIEKVGQNGEPLFGAEFVIIRNGIEVKRWTSDGMAKELYLEPGEYILRETKAPDGYKEIEDVSFIVDKIVTVNDIKISRTDTFNKYYSSQERYTDNVIKIESNDNITISSDGHTLKAINKKNSFKLRKVDGTDESKLLKNAEFALYKIIDSGNSTTREELVETRTTNESGEIEFAGLDTGSYILKENMAPEGYKKIDEELYFDVQKNGEIRFRNANKNGSSEKNYFKVIEREPIPKQVKYTELKSKKEHSTIEYHKDFKDYLNIKTEVISQDIKTVKSRIILNPSTDNTNGNGPDQPTYLTLNKNTAKTLKYKVYKVSASNKGSIYSNAQINAIESYPEVDVTEASKEIFFDTTSTRWNGDAYVVDVTAFYDEMEVGASAERNISYKWGNKPTPNIAENYLDGEVGVTVKCYEKTILVPTPPIVKVKNYKTYNFKVEKVDSKVDENGNLIHLQGAEFTLYEFTSNEETERKVVKTDTTDENGIAEFKDIKIGKYILKETKAPDGYNKIQKPIYVNISEDGKITFSNYQDRIELDSTIFTPKKEKDTTKKLVKFDEIKDRLEELNIREHSVYPDFMNLKTNLISADQNTVKTRIFLNPSTDTIKGKGPNRNTVLTLSKNNANSAEYKVYKIFKNEKASISEDELLKKTPFASGIINSNNTEANIDFKTYGTYSTPDSTDEERWQWDAYIVDIISHYNDKNDTSDETRLISYDWKYINSQGLVGDHLNGTVGATVKFKEEDVVVKKGELILQVKNSKGTKVTIVKVDENVNADGSRKVLPGAKFGLFDKDGKLIKKEDGTDYEVLTNIEGKATFEDLEAGKIYIIKELDAPVGYEKTNKTWKVVVGKDNKVQVFERVPKKPKELFKISNPTKALTYSYDNTEIFRVFPTIISNNDGSYTAKVDLRGLIDQNYDYQLALFFDTTNFEFENQNISKINGLWEKRFPLNAPKQSLEFKFKTKGNLKAIDYYPIKSIYYNTLKPVGLYELPKMQLIGNGGGEKTTEYEIVKQNNMRIFQDSYRNNICAFGSVIEPIENSNSYMLYVYYDSLYNRDTNAYMFIRLNTKLFDVENIDDYKNFFSGQLNWTFNTNKDIGREFLKFKITPKYNLAVDKLQPIASFTFNQRDIFEKDNNGLYLSYLKKKSTNNNDNDPEPNPPAPNPNPDPIPDPTPDPTKPEKEIKVKSNGNEFSFQVDNKYKGFEVEFKKIDSSSVGKPEFKYLEGAEFQILIKEGESFRPLNEEDKKFGAKDTCASDANGTISFKGLKPGTYRLTEIKAPDHYHKIDGSVVDFYIRKSDGKAFIIESDGRQVEINAESNKIKNIPKGTESFTVIKQGEANNALAGVEFTIYSIDGTKLKSGITDTNGKVVFGELDYGTYILKETKTLDGYILDSKPKIINIGKDFKVPTNVEGAKDVSKAFVLDELDENNNKVELRASEIRIDRKEVVYPNSSESIFAELHYNIDPEVEIKPGDTFTMTFNDSVDLDGIDKTPDEEFDLYGPYGKFAEAKVDGAYPNRRKIIYTVTNYVENNPIDSIYMLYPLYVNRFKYKTDDNVTVTATLGDKVYSDDIKVNFSSIFEDLKTTDKNIMAYMRELHVDTKKFKSVVYVNPKGRPRYNKRIFFNSNQKYIIDSVKIYKVIDGNKNPMPHSFGIDFNEPKKSGLEPYKGEVTGNINDFIIKDTESLTEDGKFRYGSNAAYVLEVDGTVSTENLTDFRLGYNYYEYYQKDNGYFERRWYGPFRYEDVWVPVWKEYYDPSYRETFGQFYYPDSTTEGIRKITLKNYKNKIEYTKVDGTISGTADDKKPQGATEGSNEPMSLPRPMFSSEGKALKGAEFKLKKDGVVDEDSLRVSGEDGKFSWEGLAPGKYEVWETKAPKGYPTPKKALSTFTVNDKGEIVDIKIFTVNEKGEIVDIKNNTTIIINEKYKPNIEFLKIDGNNKTVKLQGAEFTLFKAETNEDGTLNKDTQGNLNFKEFQKEVEINGKKTNKTYVVTSGEDGKFKFVKLEDGIYAVKETKAPAGYTKLLDYVFYFKVEGGKITEVDKFGKVVLVNDKGEKVEKDGKDHVVVDITLETPINEVTQIENFKAEYPATGGVGTLPFVFIGMMIMMAGAYMFIRSRDALYE